MKPYEFFFEVDGSGVEFIPFEPIHFDGLLAWSIAQEKPNARNYVHERDATPCEIELPLDKYQGNNDWCWKASALMPEGWTVETIRYVRRKFDERLCMATRGKPNLIGLTYKDKNMPHVFQLCNLYKACVCCADPEYILEKMQKIRYLGRGAARGNGRIKSIYFSEAKDDYSISLSDIATRYVPDINGWKLVRPRSEYWKIQGRVMCFVPGDNIKEKSNV